jgi:hypothetical protein
MKIGYVARRDSRSRKGTAVCVGTVNGAIKPFEGEGPWPFRRTQAAGGAWPGTRRPPHSKLVAGASDRLPHLLGIRYFEEGNVGCFYFDFYNGVMSTAQCCRLRDAFLYACSRPTKVIELVGGKDFFHERHPPKRHQSGKRSVARILVHQRYRRSGAGNPEHHVA